MTQQMPPLPPQRFPTFPLPTTPAVDSGGITLPSAKRQRLSPPSSTTPYSGIAANYQTHVINSPQIPLPIPFNSQSMPQPPSSQSDGARVASGAMGPPSRPADKVERGDRSTDLNQLSDIVSASGIDVREEENYLAQTYRNQHAADSSYANPSSQLFQSNAPSPNNHRVWSEPGLGRHGLPGDGPFNQPPVDMKTVEEDLIAKEKKAARIQAEQQQQHLRDPFLEVNTVRHRIARRANQQGVALNLEGLYDKVPEAHRTADGTKIQGPNGTGIVAVQAPSILSENASLVDIFTLISLATGERIRGIVEDAFGLARGRQYGTHGIVPPEWSPLAAGPGQPTATTTVPTSLTGTAWDRPPEGASGIGASTGLENGQTPNDVKHPLPPSNTTQKPQPTISYSSAIPATLRSLAQADYKAEEARIAARAKRQKLANPNGETTDEKANPMATVAPEVKMTKKERERLARTGQTEEVLHKAANDAASMALGGMRKKQYSWLSGGRSSSGSSTPRRMDTGSGLGSPGGSMGGGLGSGAGSAALGGNVAAYCSAGAGAAATPESVHMRVRGRRYGDWREDSKRGAGIQMRDLILALETDGREKKTLARCLAKLRSTDF